PREVVARGVEEPAERPGGGGRHRGAGRGRDARTGARRTLYTTPTPRMGPRRRVEVWTKQTPELRPRVQTPLRPRLTLRRRLPLLEERRGALPDGLGRHPARPDGVEARELEHHVHHRLLHRAAEAARAGPERLRLLHERVEGVVVEDEVHAVHREELLVLLDEGVLRLRQDALHRPLRERVERGQDGETPDELRDQAELQEVVRFDVVEDLGVVLVDVAGRGRGEADLRGAQAAGDDVLQAVERAADDEEHVARVEGDEALLGVLPAALRRDAGDGPLEHLEEGLLHALAGDVARDARVVGLARDLVDLVDVDDPALGALDVVVRGLEEVAEDALDVLADVAGLGERRRVGDRERHVEHAGERPGEQRLAGARRADEEDVRLLELDVVVLVEVLVRLDPFVVVVDGDGERALGAVLPDDVLPERLRDLGRGEAVGAAGVAARRRGQHEVAADDAGGVVDAAIADIDLRAGHHRGDLLRRAVAERAANDVFVSAVVHA